MAQDLLQGEDVSAVHHEVAGEGMPQYVGRLAGGEGDAGLDSLVEAVPAVGEQAVFLEVSLQRGFQLTIDGDRTRSLRLGVHEGHASRPHTRGHQ